MWLDGEVTVIDSKPDGKRYVRATVYSTQEPSNKPTTGEDVSGLSENDYLTSGSMLYIVSASKLYILGDDDTWYEQ